MLIFFVVMGTSTRLLERQFDRSKAVAFSSYLKSRGPASLKARGFNVTIAEGEVAYLDESTNLDTLTVNGELYCDEANAPSTIILKVKTLIINGKFQCGTLLNPYNKKLIISLKDSSIDPKVNPSYRGIIVHMGGEMNLFGDRAKSGWVKLKETAQAGQNYIIVDQGLGIKDKPLPMRFSRLKEVNGGKFQFNISWHATNNRFKVGDTIAIGPTGFNYQEAEDFVITRIDENNPNKLYLDGTLQFKHWGQKQIFQSSAMGVVVLDERAEVANLTRSIVIRGDESGGVIGEGTGEYDQRGGHVMVHHMGSAKINAVEFYKMGQAGVMARYPFHWHYVGDATGQYVKNSSVHHSFQRCITIHRTQNVTLQNNVCYNFKGHGYFLEDGNETGNRIIKNLAIKATAPSLNKLLLASDNVDASEGQGRFPSVSGFWISNPDNYIVNNVVSGCVGSGIWMSFEKEVKNSQGQVIAEPLYTDTDVFNYNKAHACKVGITWDGAPGWQNANNPNNPNDKLLTSAHYRPDTVPVFKGLRAWKNKLTGIYFRGDSAVYKNTVVADNGWSFWVAYNQIVHDSVFIGQTANFDQSMEDFYFTQQRRGRYRKTGMVLYDGPFEIHNIDFLDFSTQAQTYQIGNTTYDSTVVPFTSTGGSNKFTNLVSGLTFSPEPVYRAHMEDFAVHDKGSSMLGNAIIRDLDGSLTGTGMESVVVGTRSMAILPSSQCSEGGQSLYNFKICPASYTEGSLAFMRWGSSQASPWGTHYLVKRSDGKLSYAKNEWYGLNGYFSGFPHNLFATANSMDYSYTLLPKFQYEKDRSIGATARVDSNTESENPIIPVVKIIAYGNNCRLNDGAIEAYSLQDLESQTETAYYTDGEDFYVRVIPVERWKMIVDDPVVKATALATNKRYGIECDEGYLPTKVKGKITGVSYGENETTIKGWACNWTNKYQLDVKVYAYGPFIAQKEDPAEMSTRAVLPYANGYTSLTGKIRANKPSGDHIAMDCGNINTIGKNFEITIPNSELAVFTKHKFHVKSFSNTGGADLWIDRSGVYSVQKPVIVAEPNDDIQMK